MTSSATMHLRIAEKITHSQLIGSERFSSNSERGFQYVKFAYKKYHVCMLSTNVNQYLVF
jgi:hypothetical protein